MSYQSIKRVLGETSLERKCRFLFGVCLFFLIAGSFWWYSFLTQQLVYEKDRVTGRSLVDQIMLQKHMDFFVSHSASGVPLPNEERYLEVVQQMVENFRNQKYKYSQKFEYSLIENLNESESSPKLSKSELDLWARFSKPPIPNSTDSEDPYQYEEERPEPGRYLYYQPIRAEKTCLDFCHYTPASSGAFNVSQLPLGKVGRSISGGIAGDLQSVDPQCRHRARR